MPNNQEVKPGDIYCGQEQKTGKYFAYQIIDVMKGHMTYLLLDYFGTKLPGEQEVERMQPFKRYRWFFTEGSTSYCHSGEGTLPKDAVYVGNKAPLVSGKCNTYGSWPNGYDSVDEEQWVLIPAEARRTFKAALSNTTEITVAGIACRRSFQCIGDELLTAMIDYSELDKLPAAYTFEATRFYPLLIPFLETRWTAAKLDWQKHGQSELDLSRTHLREVSLDGEGLSCLRLPQSCEILSLTGPLSPHLRVYAPGDGSNLTLKLTGDHVPDIGLPHLRSLLLNQVANTDLSIVPCLYPSLFRLRISGLPGCVTRIDSLGELKQLGSLSIEDVFGFTAEEFPLPGTWPLLESLWLESIPEEVGKHVRKAYKGKVHSLDVRKLRKPEWLAENLDNPLRHWDGSEFVSPAKFKKSVVIYKDMRRQALAAANNYLAGKDSAALQNALEETGKEFVLAFNKLDSRSNFIETEEREDLCHAFECILDAVDAVVLLADFKMNRGRIWEVMDEHRDW